MTTPTVTPTPLQQATINFQRDYVNDMQSRYDHHLDVRSLYANDIARLEDGDGTSDLVQAELDHLHARMDKLDTLLAEMSVTLDAMRVEAAVYEAQVCS